MTGFAASSIDVLWCRRRSRLLCHVCSLAPCEPPAVLCPRCRAWLIGRRQAREQRETIADLPGVADLLTAMLGPAQPAERPPRMINGRPESEIPSAELPRDPDERLDPAEVVAAISAEPGSPAATLAERLSCSKPTIARHAARLAEQGAIRAGRDGRATVYYPTAMPEPAAPLSRRGAA